jgi:TolA-binding protein
MKTSERHQLKTNEVARQLARAKELLDTRGRQLTWIVGAVILVVLLAAAVWGWRQRTQERAGAALADATAIAVAEVVASDSGRFPSPGSYSSEQVRDEAALKKYREVIQQFPSTAAASTARFEAAAILMRLGKPQEAEQYFGEVAANDDGIHGRTAQMALAELQARGGKFEAAIATYRDLAARKDGDLPVDGVLMQLGRVYEMAGKRAEAQQTYQRVITEFPESIYAPDARRALDGLKAGAAS